MTEITSVCPICQKEFTKTLRNKLKVCCSYACGRKFVSEKMTSAPLPRFLEKIVKDEITGCWVWQGAKKGPFGGYGVFNFGGHGKYIYAHRWAYEYYKQPIPKGLVIDHLCRNRSCVNPNHLEAVSQRINVLRGDSLFAKKSRQTHCKHGHVFDSENTLFTKVGLRQCKKCRQSPSINK